MRIGSMFAGVGGLDLAAEHATGGATVWQTDHSEATARVRRRHWPGVAQYVGDVAEIDPATLPEVDALIAGFPCPDLSTAGSGLGLDGPKSGLYRHVLRFAACLRPEWLVIENVPRLLSRYRERVDNDLAALGYGTAWVPRSAAAVGAPHLRRRAFVVARWGRGGVGVVDAPTAPRVAANARCSTPAASVPNDGEDPASWLARRARIVAAGGRLPGMPLSVQASLWPTPAASDHRTRPARAHRSGHDTLPEAAAANGRLNPDWVETLVGMPVGWTLTTGPDLSRQARALLGVPRWPHGYVRELGAATPQHPWEPPRLVHGPPVSGRPARLRATGNIVVPHQGAEAIRLGMDALRSGWTAWHDAPLLAGVGAL